MHHPKTNRKMVTVAMMVAILLVAIDVTVVSTAMPRITADLGGLSQFSWVFAIYTLTTSVTTPIYGKLADLFGRRIVFTIGVILFLLGSALSGLSHNMTQLIWFRGIQGIGGGGVMPVAFTIIGDLYPGEQRARMQGVFSSIWGIAGLLGPLMGGLFVDHISWRWIFYINIPVGIISLVLVWASLHEAFEKKKHHIDVWGAMTFTLGISSLLYALINGGQKYAWGSATIIGLFVATVVFVAIFIWIEAKSPEPMLPLSLFKNNVIAVSNLVGFFASVVQMGISAYLPYWIQGILGFSATNSGLTLMPMSFAWPVGSTLAGRFMYKLGSKATTVAGSIFILAGSGWLAAVALHSRSWEFTMIMIIVGFGMGLSTTPTTVLIQSVVGWRLRGAATASSSFMRSLGQTVGIAIFGTWFNHALSTYAANNPPKGFPVQSVNINALLAGPAAIKKLPVPVLTWLHKFLESGLHAVFLVVLVVAVLTVIVSLFMPLHKTSMAKQVRES